MKLCKKCLKCQDSKCLLFNVDLSVSKSGDLIQASQCRGRVLPKKTIGNKPKTISKAKRLSKLKKELDTLWSLAVRHRDNKCVMCGATENLQAHHWIRTKAQGNTTRWDIRNGASLCYCCHIHKIHSNPSIDNINKLRAGMSFISDEVIQELLCKNEVVKFTEDDLIKIKESLKKGA